MTFVAVDMKLTRKPIVSLFASQKKMHFPNGVERVMRFRAKFSRFRPRHATERDSRMVVTYDERAAILAFPNALSFSPRGRICKRFEHDI
jgi:hypothetical protein